MVKEAEANKEADEKRKGDVEIRNKAEQLVGDIDDQLAKNGDKMDANTKAQTQALRDEVKQALDKNDIETLKAKLDQLEKMAANASNYQQQANTNSSTTETNTSSEPHTEDGKTVYDANYTEKK